MLKNPKALNVLGPMLMIAFSLIIISLALSKDKNYNGTYCKGGYVFIDEDTWHGNNDKQLISENGGGVPCKN